MQRKRNTQIERETELKIEKVRDRKEKRKSTQSLIIQKREKKSKKERK